MTIDTVTTLTNEALTATLGRLAAGEREATAALIAHLAEFDARRLYEPAGFSSMFKYCRTVLKLSEDAAYNRIEAARAARRCPAVLNLVASGALSVTTARMLARHLTAENQWELLAAAAGKGKDEVEELLADRMPRPDVTPSVRRVPDERALRHHEPLGSITTPPIPEAAGPALIPAPSPVAPSEGPVSFPALQPGSPSNASGAGAVRPLGAARYEMRFTATAEMREKLRRAQELLGHAVPNGDLSHVFERALDALIGVLERKKLAAASRPRPVAQGVAKVAPVALSRHIPAVVKRAVVARDQGRCAFVSEDGRRCDERRRLEFHHVVPFAVNGRATVANIRLRCRAHNGHEVDRFFGPGWRRTGSGEAVAGATTRSGTSAPPR